MSFFSKLGSLFSLSIAALKSDTLGSLLSSIVKYSPLIIAVIEAIEKNKTEAESQLAAQEFERGFRVLTQTKDPTALHDAILKHCNSVDGCMLP